MAGRLKPLSRSWRGLTDGRFAARDAGSFELSDIAWPVVVIGTDLNDQERTVNAASGGQSSPAGQRPYVGLLSEHEVEVHALTILATRNVFAAGPIVRAEFVFMSTFIVGDPDPWLTFNLPAVTPSYRPSSSTVALNGQSPALPSRGGVLLPCSSQSLQGQTPVTSPGVAWLHSVSGIGAIQNPYPYPYATQHVPLDPPLIVPPLIPLAVYHGGDISTPSALTVGFVYRERPTTLGAPL